MNTDIIASTHLGKKSEGSVIYNPSLLVAVPREENRKLYGINVAKQLSSQAAKYSGKLKVESGKWISEDRKVRGLENKSFNVNSYSPNPLTLLPSAFVGFDIWHAYEFSCMTENGIPVTMVMKMKYPCNNEFLVESKSLKLYLNSFNMMKFGKNTQECLSICKKMIEKDLSELLKTTVEINFLDKNTEQVRIFEDFENIMNFVDETALQITDFKENPEILQVEEAQEKEYKLTFESLRSNCRVTHQPDFGDAFIYYKSKKHIKEDSLVKYLTSFRSEYHFHEECCEMIFKRLSDILDEDDELMVCALYTRRGGIDICPVRWKAVKQLGGHAAKLDKSEIIQKQQSDNDLFAYSPICLLADTVQFSINNMINLTKFARNGIKQ